jgi:glyoxylase-like metal-dependent hydrolase (beta-lactamase superfamily II)
MHSTERVNTEETMRHNPLKKTLYSMALAAAFAVGTAGGPAAPAAWAAAPLAATQAPGFYRFMLGAFEITALSDGTVDLPVDQLLKQAPGTTVQALHAAYLDAPLETSVNAYLINTGSRLVLVDAGAGALFGPTLGKLAANLKASGYRPEDVDDVILTHLHPDHVGGLAEGAGRVFPNAVVHVEKHEADFWLSKANLDAAPSDSKGFFQGAAASVGPYTAAGKVVPFEGRRELVPGVTALASSGHTVGHTSYLIESGGRKLLLVGDLIHVPAVQLGHPDVTIAFDADAKGAVDARARVFGQAARDGTLVGASHIAFPGLGHLRTAGKGYEWVPVNYARLR